jgi:hypothetical protein
MSRKLDVMWDYGEPKGGFNKQRLNCKLCGKNTRGGINRLKYHLAQILGHEVGVCPDATPEIIHIVDKALDAMGIAREHREDMKALFGSGGGGRSKQEEVTLFLWPQPPHLPQCPHNFFFLEPHLVRNLLSSQL